MAFIPRISIDVASSARTRVLRKYLVYRLCSFLVIKYVRTDVAVLVNQINLI